MKKILKKRLLINLVKTFISFMILFFIFFLVKEHLINKISKPYNYKRVIK